MISAPTTNGLASRAMLASIRISFWEGTLTDKKVTSDVARQHQVSEKRAGKWRKNAIDIDAPSYRAMIAARSELRSEFYRLTLPWTEGTRIFSAPTFPELAERIRHLIASFNAALDLFELDYPRLCRMAASELNGMYNPRDYPINIRAKFDVRFCVMPLPSAEDFRVALPPEALADFEAEITHAVQGAMQEPYKRLHKHLSRMVERLADPKATFRDTLTEGLTELCDTMPDLNLTGDQTLTDLTQRCEDLVAHVDPQTLRDSPTVRSHVCAEAQAIMDTMAAFMGVQS